MSAKAPAKGHTAKHTAAKKHATSSGKSGTKHTPAKQKKPVTAKSKGQALVHAIAAHAKQAKPAGFAVGDLLPVCSFEAVAQWLRLAGQPVHEDEVAQLWWLAGEREASIPEAAEAFGLAAIAPFGCPRSLPSADGPGYRQFCDAVQASQHPLILHVDIPGPHAVLTTADGWWSWGELYSPWPCQIDEAWAVSWS